MSRGGDREEEVPIGSFRFIPVPGTARGTVVFPRRRDGESPALGRGFDTSAFVVAGLRFEYRDGEVVAVHTACDQAALNRCWQAELCASDALASLPKQWALGSPLQAAICVIPIVEPLPGPDIVLIHKAGLPLTPAAELLANLFRAV